MDPTRAPEPGPGLRVVIVEDDPDYAWLVQEMLRDSFAGEQLEVVAFGTLADMKADPLVADCALVDLSLPDARGLEILGAVREVLPGSPIVVLTGAEDEEMALEAVERGAQDYLVKRRVNTDSLGRSIRYAIERHRGERQRVELLQARAAHAEAEALSGTLSRLQAVADAAIAVQTDRRQVDRLLDMTLDLIAAEAGALILQDRGSGRLTVIASQGMPAIASGGIVDAVGVVARTFELGETVVLADVASEPGEPLGIGIASLVSVPLQVEDARIGALLAAAPLPGRFSDEQARLLALAAERCARGLANAFEYERERRTAAALETGLLPQGPPELDNGEIAVRYLPARGGPAVGGDWYDAIVLPDGRVGLAIGDAAGHGAEAAALMGQMRAALRAYALEGIAPAVVATRLNALALSLGESAIATLIYVVLEPDLTSGTYINAGHPPPVIVGREEARMLLPAGSAPAGVSPAAEFEEHELTLEPGEALCLYSDGLVEDRGTHRIDRDRMLLDALGGTAPAEVLCERALATLRPSGAADDDVALLVIRARAFAEGLRTTHPATPDALADARSVLGDWLAGIGASGPERMDILMACNEACMNVVEHAYDGGRGDFSLEGHVDGRTVVVIVRDQGQWAVVRSRGHGRGLKMMEGLMDSVQLSFSSEGTVVVLRRELEAVAV